MKTIEIKVSGMNCPNCEKHIREILEKKGAKKIFIVRAERMIYFKINDLNKKEMERLLKDSGYKVISILVK